MRTEKLAQAVAAQRAANDRLERVTVPVADRLAILAAELRRLAGGAR